MNLEGRRGWKVWTWPSDLPWGLNLVEIVCKHLTIEVFLVHAIGRAMQPRHGTLPNITKRTISPNLINCHNSVQLQRNQYIFRIVYDYLFEHKYLKLQKSRHYTPALAFRLQISRYLTSIQEITTELLSLLSLTTGQQFSFIFLEKSDLLQIGLHKLRVKLQFHIIKKMLSQDSVFWCKMTI